MTLAHPDPMNGVAQFNQFRPMTPSIPLSRLIDFSVQRTYHELQVLADLLPRKSDLERKVEIVKFAHKTRQTFIRLLALVKWAGSASKVDKSATIISFLDKQSMLFVDTADNLAKMARESLVQARLPCFQLPAAVEVLTLGSYSRLPTCIRERIVPPDPITPAEKRATLLRLNQIIQQRLVTTNLPNQLRNLRIENGRVTFHVDYEFELSLTLMGDGATIPWRVLSVDILVTDKETGDGRDLVNQYQKNYIRDLIQSRLIENNDPLIDAFNVLHSFCLSLQLEVLQAQSRRLIVERLGDFIKIEQYDPGRLLSLLYWRDPSLADSKHKCKLTLEIDPAERNTPLQVKHNPCLGVPETLAANEAMKSECLSIEKLLTHTTHERAKEKLQKLKAQLDELRIGETLLSGCPPILEVAFISHCMQSEKLLVSIDMLTGAYFVHIPQFEDCPLVSQNNVQIALKDFTRIRNWIKDLRIWVLKERCRKTAEAIPIVVLESLPFATTKSHAFLSSSTPKLFFQFSKHSSNFLMVTFEEKDGETCQKYYLLAGEHCAVDSLENQPSLEVELPKCFVNVTSVFEIDILSLFKPSEVNSGRQYGSGKRKLQHVDQEEQLKKIKTSGFMSNLAYLLSFCEEKLYYGALSSELQRRGICHHVRVANERGYTHLVDLVQFPPNPSTPPSLLQNHLLSCIIRLQGRGSKILLWTVSFCFCNCPVKATASKENSAKQTVHLMYDFSRASQAQIVQMVDELLEDWSALEKLYEVVHSFSTVAAEFPSVAIKSFNYKKVFLSYGPNKSLIVSILWKSSEKRFQLNFGVIGSASSNNNPHILVSSQLQHDFNLHKSLAKLCQTLTTTLPPLSVVVNLTSMPLPTTMDNWTHIPIMSFVLIPQSSAHWRLVYRNTFCIDIAVNTEGKIAVSDGAFSMFDKSKVIDGLSPISGFEEFASKILLRLNSSVPDVPQPSPASQADLVLFDFNQLPPGENSPLFHAIEEILKSEFCG
ncbi:Mediator of RNA polymerase II transcription subunit 14 [Halotydeus destructor]|nr:Mediator of RNA polymerase II transcription subunit 14 [Halotydeus destructor]